MKAFDITKFRKSLTKNMPNISVGFRDPKIWIDTGNFTLNRLISGDFYKGIPLGKVTVLAGESGSGKSFIASGNVIREAQKQGIFVVLIDTENALDTSWLEAMGVEVNDNKLLKINAAMIDDVAKIISDFMKDYKAQYGSEPEDDRPKVLFVIDSLGMLMTPTEVDQFGSGELKGDFGRKPKALKALVTNCVNMFGEYDVGLLATNHSYASQDQYNPDDIISGGSGFIYASSIALLMKKLKLKEDEEGNKVKQVLGIRCKIKVVKTRYSKPFEEVEIHIPWNEGMNPYSGLFEFFEAHGAIQKDGNKYIYVDKETGEIYKYWRKEINRNENGILDLIMKQYTDEVITIANEIDVDEDA
jgi:recombination protein RecA